MREPLATGQKEEIAVGSAWAMELAPELRGRLPLVVGAVGHRDLREEDLAELERKVGEVFDRIAADYLSDRATPIVVLSALAEGADQLVARVALGRGALLVAPLPMPIAEYRRDFQPGLTPHAETEFDRLLALAVAAPEMRLVEGNTIETIRTDAARRALQYREAGRFIVRHCQILLSLWDGDEREAKMGGTAEIVRLQREGVPLENAESARARIDGTEIGPLINIATPRLRSAPESITISTSPWGRALTADRRPTTSSDRDREAWREFETWIRLTTTFNSDATRIASSREGVAKIEQTVAQLFDAPDAPMLAAKGRACGSTDAPLWCAIYAVADVLAQDYQTRFARVWTTLFTLAFLMAATLALVARAPPNVLYALAFYQVLIIASIGLHRHARRRHFQEKFLDYRALCEATRVAVFWRIAHIDKSIADIYPICQSPELSWVKTSIRSIECIDAGRAAGVDSLGETRYEICRAVWVEGQLRYFMRRGRNHRQTAARRKRWSVASLAITAVGTILIALADYFAFDWRGVASFTGAALAPFVIALLPASAAALAGHAEQLGRTAQAHQYDRMRSLYERALRLLPRSLDLLSGDAAREVFFEVGREAVQESASWTAIFRLRPI